jgi:hypothetical protein
MNRLDTRGKWNTTSLLIIPKKSEDLRPSLCNEPPDYLLTCPHPNMTNHPRLRLKRDLEESGVFWMLQGYGTVLSVDQLYINSSRIRTLQPIQVDDKSYFIL